MANSPLLPAWLNAALPEVQPASVVSLSPERQLLLTHPDGSSVTYATAEELDGAARGVDFTVEPEVFEEYEGDEIFGLTYSAGRNLVGMVLSMTDRERLESVERDYESSLRAAIRYEADPTDFQAAYHFVDSHPAFWTQEENSPDGISWHWTTAGHCGRIWQAVMPVEEDEHNPDGHPSGYVIALETGGHVEDGENLGRPPYTTHYHDYRLDVYAPTFEEAYVQLAALVHKFYNTDGTDRGEVEHEKPEWVVTLEERIRDFDEDRELEGIEAATEAAEENEND